VLFSSGNDVNGRGGKAEFPTVASGGGVWMAGGMDTFFSTTGGAEAVERRGRFSTFAAGDEVLTIGKGPVGTFRTGNGLTFSVTGGVG